MLLRRLLFTLIILVVLLEVLLRLIGPLKTYSEVNYGEFLNPFEKVYESHYWLWSPYDTVEIVNAEFTYRYTTNSIGLVDTDIPEGKEEKTLALVGDSFTQGQGAPQDSSMPRLFEDRLLDAQEEMFVLNAGIPSGDLFYYTKLVEDKLLPIGIKKYMFVVNTSDIYDYIWMGGRERFRDDGTTVSRESPWYMGIYERSHFFRAIFHGILGYDHSYISKNRAIKLKEEAVDRFVREFEYINETMEGFNAEFLVVIHPVARQYSGSNKSYVRDYLHMRDLYNALQTQDYNVVNLESYFAAKMNPSNYLQYSWPLDKHFNSRGYALFADLVFEAVEEEYPAFLDFASLPDSTVLNAE